MFEVRYKGKRIEATRSAAEELAQEGKTLLDVKEILEEGYEPRQRKEGKVEKWLDKGDKTYNAVLAEGYNEVVKEKVWILLHFGKFAKRD